MTGYIAKRNGANLMMVFVLNMHDPERIQKPKLRFVLLIP